MKKEKDKRLVDIYFRIHNKGAITIDDLAYLAMYNPVCFKKTCDKLTGKVSEEPGKEAFGETPAAEASLDASSEPVRNSFRTAVREKVQNRHTIQKFIEGLKKMESNNGIDTMQKIDAVQVKELLGEFFMENLLSCNSRRVYFSVVNGEADPEFNVRV